jgi:hypothetical protein
MGNLVPLQQTSLMLKSASELERTLYLPFLLFADLPSEFLPELAGTFAAIQKMCWMIEAAIEDSKWTEKYKASPEHIQFFLQSDFYQGLRLQLEGQQSADEDDAALVVRVLLSTLPINTNIDPQALAEVIMEVIREVRPTKLALDLARISLRNKMTFAPTAKEFRDTLMQTVESLARLHQAVLALAEKAERHQSHLEQETSRKLIGDFGFSD